MVFQIRVESKVLTHLCCIASELSEFTLGLNLSKPFQAAVNLPLSLTSL